MTLNEGQKVRDADSRPLPATGKMMAKNQAHLGKKRMRKRRLLLCHPRAEERYRRCRRAASNAQDKEFQRPPRRSKVMVREGSEAMLVLVERKGGGAAGKFTTGDGSLPFASQAAFQSALVFSAAERACTGTRGRCSRHARDKAAEQKKEQTAGLFAPVPDGHRSNIVLSGKS